MIKSATRTVIGIDVGGPQKGFHAIALKSRQLVAKTKSREATTIANWCRAQVADVVAVDAPCRWRSEALARAAERQMAAEGICCYYAPTEQKAKEHAFYTWMLPGKALYEALSPDFSLYMGEPISRPVCIETFPHAVACALAGGVVSAKEKRAVRGELLHRAGLSLSDFSSIDEIDAALCALAAESFAHGAFSSYGDPEGGFIIVPSETLPSSAEAQNTTKLSQTRPDDDCTLAKILSLLPSLTAAERIQLSSLITKDQAR